MKSTLDIGNVKKYVVTAYLPYLGAMFSYIQPF